MCCQGSWPEFGHWDSCGRKRIYSQCCLLTSYLYVITCAYKHKETKRHNILKFVCVYICIHIHTHTHIFCYLYVCFQNWPFGTRWTVRVLLPGEDCFLRSQASLVACGSLYRTKALWVSLFPLASLLFLSLFTSYLSSHVGEALWVQLGTFLETWTLSLVF